MSTIMRTGGNPAKYEGDATAAQVLSGKTFYSDSKELKTGTLAIANTTAVASDVAYGKTFFSKNTTMKTGAGMEDITSLCSSSIDYNILTLTLPSGYSASKIKSATICGYYSYYKLYLISIYNGVRDLCYAWKELGSADNTSISLSRAVALGDENTCSFQIGDGTCATCFVLIQSVIYDHSL